MPPSFLRLIILTSLFFTAIIHAADKPITIPGLKRDIEFAKVGEVSLTLDAFVPEGEGPFAKCILVHGGGIHEGGQADFHHEAL
jgi:acetyl esterase